MEISNKTVIIADTTCDLSDELIEKYQNQACASLRYYSG